MKENIEPLLEASRYLGLEINAEKANYMITSRHPNSEQDQNVRIANELFENVAKFKYVGTTLTNQNDIHDVLKRKLNSGNACYYSVSAYIKSEDENIKSCNFTSSAVWVRNLDCHFEGGSWTECV
jgi:hypothetical protein